MNDFDDYHDNTGRAVPHGWAICALAVIAVLFWIGLFAWAVL